MVITLFIIRFSGPLPTWMHVQVVNWTCNQVYIIIIYVIVDLYLSCIIQNRTNSIAPTNF